MPDEIKQVERGLSRALEDEHSAAKQLDVLRQTVDNVSDKDIRLMGYAAVAIELDKIEHKAAHEFLNRALALYDA